MRAHERVFVYVCYMRAGVYIQDAPEFAHTECTVRLSVLEEATFK